MRKFVHAIVSTLPTAALFLAPWVGWWMLLVYIGLVLLSHKLVIDDKRDRLLITRYYLLRLPLCRIWLHQMHGHDMDEHPHNHPHAHAASLILRGGYLEYRHGRGPGREPSLSGAGSWAWFQPGDWNLLKPTDYHRLEDVRPGTWTLFFASWREKREWGFLTANGHVDWRAYGR